MPTRGMTAVTAESGDEEGAAARSRTLRGAAPTSRIALVSRVRREQSEGTALQRGYGLASAGLRQLGESNEVSLKLRRGGRYSHGTGSVNEDSCTCGSCALSPDDGLNPLSEPSRVATQSAAHASCSRPGGRRRIVRPRRVCLPVAPCAHGGSRRPVLPPRVGAHRRSIPPRRACADDRSARHCRAPRAPA